MTLETVSTLEETTVDTLRDLVQVNIDSRDGFREAASATSNPTLKGEFETFARERARQADELLTFVDLNGNERDVEGSYAAKLHRTWINIRTALSSDHVQVVLDEAERGEDVIKAAYEDALKKTAGSAVNDVLMSHMKDVKASHDRIRAQRDLHRAKK